MQHPTTRREFLASSAAAAALPLTRHLAPVLPRAPLKILILGGTGYLGPETVEVALAHKHEVTLFNRGRTNPQLFPDVEKLHGDRDPKKGDGLKALEGTRKWDVVIDNSGYVPRIVGASAELLKERAQHYVFVSTCSVYEDVPGKILDESAKLMTAPVAVPNGGSRNSSGLLAPMNLLMTSRKWKDLCDCEPWSATSLRRGIGWR